MLLTASRHAPDAQQIREDANNGVYLTNAHEVAVTDLEQCLHYLELGERNRTFAFTHLNAHSSRSHAVLMVTVVKSRKYLTNAEKAEIRKAEKEGVVTQKVRSGWGERGYTRAAACNMYRAYLSLWSLVSPQPRSRWASCTW